jgi:hypothetical protein
MRLVTDDPIVYITYILWSIALVAALIGLAFLAAVIDVYIVQPYKRRRGKK